MGGKWDDSGLGEGFCQIQLRAGTGKRRHAALERSLSRIIQAWRTICYNPRMGEKICVVGLGYVGLPLAVAFARKFSVVGCDANPDRIRELRDGRDSAGEVSPDDFAAVSENLSFSASAQDARQCGVFIIAVPTPVCSDRRPDLAILEGACRSVGAVLKPGDLVVVESTVYPGVTEEICAPILEKESGLKFNRDFACGYSPERLRPGTAFRNLTDIVKITAGSTPEAAARTDALYRQIITAGTFPAQSIRAAEAAKILENTQRDINIAVMNEAAMICRALDLDSRAVFAAAASKWDFLKFEPGLVGGHCIGVDPYYLSHKAQTAGHLPELILAARQINDEMGAYVAAQTLDLMTRRNVAPKGARVLILGFTFKENCADPRNSRVWDIYRELTAGGCEVEICDPVADLEKTRAEYGIAPGADLTEALSRRPQAVVFAVAHDIFRDIAEKDLGDALIIDVKGIAPRADWRL